MVKPLTGLVVEDTIVSGVEVNDGPDVDPVPGIKVDPVRGGVTGT